MLDYAAATLPDPTHWAIPLGLATLVAFLIRSAWKDLRRPDRVPDDAGPDPRAPLFRETTITLWFVCMVTTVSWFIAGGASDALGFVPGTGWGATAAWIVAVLGSAFLVYQWRVVKRSPEAQDQYATQVDEAKGFDWVRPTTPLEYRLFQTMAVTAGITEEVIFRGFLIGVLALWVPVWVAGVLALLVFVGAHVYQGFSGMMRILPVSTVLTILFLASGSLLPGILLHAVVDLVGGAILWILRDRRRAAAGTDPDRGEADPGDASFGAVTQPIR